MKFAMKNHQLHYLNFFLNHLNCFYEHIIIVSNAYISFHYLFKTNMYFVLSTINIVINNS